MNELGKLDFNLVPTVGGFRARGKEGGHIKQLLEPVLELSPAQAPLNHIVEGPVMLESGPQPGQGTAVSVLHRRAADSCGKSPRPHLTSQPRLPHRERGPFFIEELSSSEQLESGENEECPKARVGNWEGNLIKFLEGRL
ncbi:unnamed protein product [Pleuronectes platessa]|uniref:Uncharacterized protein n=1 Tax=Pleuronectes platessa TaxID=8262 RepID=A0A9N7V4H6_PLEPL|nr:unnamed protein product [Pleuronectes platessa]